MTVVEFAQRSVGFVLFFVVSFVFTMMAAVTFAKYLFESVLLVEAKEDAVWVNPSVQGA